MVRKCSYCGRIGHNSRTCNTYKNTISTTSTSSVVNNGIRLFGVQLELSSSCPSSCCSHVNNNNIAMKKCFSLDCLLSSSPPPPLNYSSPSPSTSSWLSINENNSNKTSVGYFSDSVGRAQEKKKAVKTFSFKKGPIQWLPILQTHYKIGLGYMTLVYLQILKRKISATYTLMIVLHIGESNKPTQSQANMFNSKPIDTNNAGNGDDQFLARTSSHDVQSDSFQLQVSHNKAMPTWPCRSSSTSHKNSSSSKSIIPLMKSISPNEAPNLELALAPSSPTPTARSFYQDNSTPTSLHCGPISVI
ncbi:hypothetical protein LguiB_018560 [Lonicera macranthoides]